MCDFSSDSSSAKCHIQLHQQVFYDFLHFNEIANFSLNKSSFIYKREGCTLTAFINTNSCVSEKT